jgi:carotenoid cleavage dioxygenase-like enzyme
MTVVENKWLQGAYAPIPGDVTATELTVEGTLPAELEGRYLRNGPNPIGPVDPATHHWFTGDGMVHGVRLGGGRADWYHARMVRSTAVSEVLGEEPATGERHGGFDTANTNVIGLAGKTFALVEAGARPVELSYDLDTVCHSDLDGTLPHGYTAHPKVDPVTGDVHAIAYHWAIPHLEYIVAGADGRVKQVSPVEVADGPMVHDCSITERWTVVYDLPVTFDLDVAMSGGGFPYRWNDARPARLGLIPLGGSGADVRWFEIAPCYSYHPLNAHDDGDLVVLDVVRYERMFDRRPLGPDDSTPLLWRWTIDTAAGTVREEQLSDQPMEFPRVDERLVGRPHRWGYASQIGRSDLDNDFGGGNHLIRIDAKSGDATRVDLGDRRFGGEWVMVPRHADSAEDDGWLLSLVYDADADRSELVVLPAADPADGPIARVLLPNRVPLGFHGNWVPDPT